MSKRLYWLVTGVYWAGIFTLTHLPAGRIPPTKVNDKIEHMAAYGVLGILLFATLRVSGWTLRQTAITVLGIGMVYGIADELLQIPVGRSADINDWLADIAGLTTAVLICSVVELVGSRGNRPQMDTDEHG